MSLLTGRQGYIGYALETTPGTPEASPVVFLPTTDNSFEDKHEKLLDISSRASRIKDHDALKGKQWGEGDLGLYLDATNAGYLLKAALGNEVKTDVQASPNVDNHQFFVTASGNTAKTATLWNFRGSDPSVKRYTRVAVDTLELEVTNDGLATVTASLMGSNGTKVSAPTLTTTSGTIFTWCGASLQFGDTVAAARLATATKITNFKMSLANNLELVYRSGSCVPDAITLGDAEVTGEYTLLFEDDTELDAYINNSRRSMVMTLTGASIGGVTEQLELVFERMVLDDKSIETGQDSLFAMTGNYRAINDGAGQLLVANLQNAKTTVY